MREEFSVYDQVQSRQTGKITPDRGFQMRLSDVDGCADQMKATLSPSTAARYRKAILDFYEFLPEDKRVFTDSLPAWLESLRGRYSSAHINAATSACNAFLRYAGHEEYQLARYIVKQEPSQKEISREDYLRLLAKAKKMRKQLAYLAMRAFACTGMETAAFLALTVEDVRDGVITDGDRTIRLPDSLREELLDHALHTGVRSGRLFVNRAGGPLNAQALRLNINQVSKAAGYADGVACAGTLRKLYETTRAELMAKAVERLMLEQAAQEQAEHGWKA